MKVTAKAEQFRRASRFLLFLFAVLLAACGQLDERPALEPLEGPAPLLNAANPERIAGSYIVVLKPGVRARALAA